MSFVLVTLMFFHGEKISMDKLHYFSVEDYVGGMITDCVDFNVDMFSYFEFLGYVKEFGYNSSSAVIYVRPPNCPGLVVIKVDMDLMGICEELKSGDILEVYVDHMVDDAIVVPPLLEYVSQVGEGGDSNVTFQKESGQDLGGCEGLGTSEKASNTAKNSANNKVPTAVTTDDSSNSLSESNSSESSSSTDNSSDSELEELFEEGEADYGSDTHEECMEFRAERRTIERRKRKESAPEQEHVKLGKRGPDVGYDEYESRKKNSLEVLEENTKRSIKCNIFWNGEFGFEVKQGSDASEVKHMVDINMQTCTCITWMLKDIPCAHAVAALHYKNLEPLNYISHWYSNATYMKTYSYFLQPVLGMNMCPESQNPTVIPPHVKKMPGRPKKVRRKEPGENKTGKLSKSEVEMTCRNFHNKGHNKRGCHKAAGSNTTATSASSVPASVGSSKPPKQSTGRGRGRPKRSKEKDVGTSTDVRTQYNRPRMVGMGVLHTQSGFKIQNPGMSSTNFKNVRSSAEVTGDLGHQPTRGVKWKGKEAMTSRQLQQLRDKKLIQTRSRAAKLSQESTTAKQPN
ncbi:hypothetical protein A4A49_03973 [Nicotiana attenuata]|uniref:SWIM-type domain-containing protein n=1 Tax=Nicotiana attenuata TaxID=49451 RepID=A0A1J6IZG2_NICAT|nr:hypothetical protein A4A49_03973 [Nicotiana attenuata]